MKNKPRWLIAVLILTALSPAVNGQSVKTWLDGTGSQYCDTARWTQVSGLSTDTIPLSTPDGLLCEATFSKEGIFLFELKCTNPYGEGRDTVRVTVIRTILALDTAKYTPVRVNELKITFIQQPGRIKLYFQSPQSAKLQVAIADALGRMVYKGELSINAGDSQGYLPMPYRTGFYVILIKYKDRIITQKIITTQNF